MCSGSDMTPCSRYGWIEACLRYGGAFGPADKKTYARVFDLTEATSSRDQSSFVAAMKGEGLEGLVVKSKGKLRLTGSLPERPVYDVPSLATWLERSLGDRYVPPPSTNSGERGCVGPVVEALRAGRVIAFTTTQWGKRKMVVVSPHVLVDEGSRLMLVGWDHAHNEMREYAVRAIEAVYADGARRKFVPPRGSRRKGAVS